MIHWLSFVRCFVHNKPKLKFTHSSNHTEHCRKWLHYLTGTKNDCTSAQRIFNWNISVTDNKKERISSPQHKQLPRSPENSSVSTSTLPRFFQFSVNIRWYIRNRSLQRLPSPSRTKCFYLPMSREFHSQYKIMFENIIFGFQYNMKWILIQTT
jgi:hypothetical protein